MAVSTSDTVVNGYLYTIQAADFGRDCRSAIANSVLRCYELAKIRVGQVLVPASSINAQVNIIRTSEYGEDVRTALRDGLNLCYQAANVSVSSAARSWFNSLLEAQMGTDLKNAILNSIARCCQDVK